jgi:hypothetical protein
MPAWPWYDQVEKQRQNYMDPGRVPRRERKTHFPIHAVIFYICVLEVRLSALRGHVENTNRLIATMLKVTCKYNRRL